MSDYAHVPQAVGIGRAAMLQPRTLSDGQPTTEKTRGDIYADIRARLDAQPMVARCAFCPDWQFEGTAAEGRDAQAAHRAEAHPDAKLRRGRRRTPGLTWSKADKNDPRVTEERAEANRIRAEKEDAERLAKVERAKARGEVIGPHHDSRETGKEAEGAAVAEDAGTGVAAVSSIPAALPAAIAALPSNHPVRRAYITRPGYRREWLRARRAGGAAA